MLDGHKRGMIVPEKRKRKVWRSQKRDDSAREEEKESLAVTKES